MERTLKMGVPPTQFECVKDPTLPFLLQFIPPPTDSAHNCLLFQTILRFFATTY